MPPQDLTAQAVADLVGGRLSGNGDLTLRGVATLDEARPDQVSFLASPKYLPQFARTRAGCVLLPVGLEAAEGPPSVARVVVSDPREALARLLAHLHPVPAVAAGVHPSALIGPGTRLGEGVAIAAGVVIGARCTLGHRVRLGPGVVLEDDVAIGDDSTLGPKVVCHHGVCLGARVEVKAGAVIGGPGFGYIAGPAGHQRMPHPGGCRLGDDVGIGANCCIDRGTLDDTVIGRGTKLDNLVHVAHNVRIGEDCLLMAGVGIAGSTRIGNRVVLAGQVGIVGHVVIGDDVRVGAQGGVTGSVPAGTEVSGYPARPHREYMRAVGAMYRLAPFARRLEQVARRGEEDA